MKNKPSQVIGWDIGGAHLKAAYLRDGTVCAVVQTPCALWQGLAALDEAWSHTIQALNTDAEHAVTMTGELADCFASRREGVAAILAAVARYVQKPFQVYAGEAGLVNSTAATPDLAHTASANWHATAACLGRVLGGAGVLLDIGTTTTDIVPFTATGAAAVHNDHTRLQSGELVYTGVVRTPVMALCNTVQVNGQSLPLVAEQFANTADVYRVLGSLPAAADLHPTCDGADKTREASARRLARMFGCDYGDAQDWTPHAHALAHAQLTSIKSALHQVIESHVIDDDAPLIAAGVGRFLVPPLARHLARSPIDFADLFTMTDDVDGGALTARVGDCASAVALAHLMYDESLTD